MLPLTMDQKYVKPPGPEAVLPVEPAQTCAGVGVIVGGAGLALMVTLAVFEDEQPLPSVTVSVRPTVPEAPAV